jgi:hypothetical protein
MFAQNCRSASRLGLLNLVLVTATLSGCGVDVKWTEEVKLADGQVIIVKRTAQGKPLGRSAARWLERHQDDA